jgi:hypothetical protein
MVGVLLHCAAFAVVLWMTARTLRTSGNIAHYPG